MRITKIELERICGYPGNGLMVCTATQLGLRPGSWPRTIEVIDGKRRLTYRPMLDDLAADGKVLAKRFYTRSEEEIQVVSA